MVTERQNLDNVIAEYTAYVWMVECDKRRSEAQQVLEAMEVIEAGAVKAKA